MFSQSLGVYNFIWYGMAVGALWLLYRIFEILKAIHTIELDRFKRERPDVFADD